MDSVLPSITAAGISVTGIGVGGQLPASLRNAVSLTGGSFTVIPSTDQIASFYSQIADQLTGADRVGQVDASVAPGETRDHIFQVASTASEATLKLFWGENRGSVDFTLRDPSGTVIDTAYAKTHDDVEFINLEEHGYAQIERPEPGAWVMRVAGVASVGGFSDRPKLQDNRSNDIPYTAAASTRSNLQVSVFTEGNEYQPGSPMKVAAAVSDLGPILGATVTALVNYHTNFASTAAPVASFLLPFSDANKDGVYEAEIPGSQVAAGTYQFELTAAGVSNGTPGVAFTRQLTEYVTEVPSLRLTAIRRESSGDVLLTWQPALANTAIEFSTNLVTWESLTNNVPGTTWSGRLPGSPVQAFLRLRASPQAP